MAEIKQAIVKLVAVAILAIVLNASIDDFVIGLLGGWFIIFLWSRRP